ncbi:Cell division protein ZapA OS=Afipia felis OX=1035 GN=NCTC12722_03538 PE=4 SV=1 [Afipia felis]
MSHVNVTINGRQYRMACEEGQETRLLRLAEMLESRVTDLRGKFGEIGDQRLTVMASLTIADELNDAERRIRGFEEELEVLREGRVAAADRARATQSAIANALNAASERIERMTQELNKPLAENVALG